MIYLRNLGIPKDYVQSVFRDKRLALVFPKTTKEAEYFNDRLIGPNSVRRGVKFWEEHRLALERAVLAHPKLKQEYIISILRIESDLGGNGGHAPAINYLYTWVVRAHASQDKRDFAKWQLYHLLSGVLKRPCHRHHIEIELFSLMHLLQFRHIQLLSLVMHKQAFYKDILTLVFLMQYPLSYLFQLLLQKRIQ